MKIELIKRTAMPDGDAYYVIRIDGMWLPSTATHDENKANEAYKKLIANNGKEYDDEILKSEKI